MENKFTACETDNCKMALQIMESSFNAVANLVRLDMENPDREKVKNATKNMFLYFITRIG